MEEQAGPWRGLLPLRPTPFETGSEQQAGLEAQERDLKAAGAEEIHSEQVSSIGRRPGLEQAISFCRKGDTLVVTRLDRLARSVTHMWEIVRRLDDKGVGLRILDLSIDTHSSVGKLVLSVMGGHRRI